MDENKPPDDDDDDDARYASIHKDLEAELYEEPNPEDIQTSGPSTDLPIAATEVHILRPEASSETDEVEPKKRPGFGSTMGAIMREMGRALVTELQRKIDESAQTGDETGSRQEAEVTPLNPPPRASAEQHADDPAVEDDDDSASAEIIDLNAERRKRGGKRYGLTLGEATREGFAQFLVERGQPVSKDGETLHFEMDLPFLKEHGKELLSHLLTSMATRVDPDTLAPREGDPEVNVEFKVIQLLDEMNEVPDEPDTEQ